MLKIKFLNTASGDMNFSNVTFVMKNQFLSSGENSSQQQGVGPAAVSDQQVSMLSQLVNIIKRTYQHILTHKLVKE